MAQLDLNYIADLILQAQNGDSDAFAEFYAATYNKQYLFAIRCLKDEFLAVEALRETYSRALKELSKLREPLLAITWLTQFNLRCCYEIQVRKAAFDKAQGESVDETELPLLDSQTVHIEGADYTMQQVMNLPFSESQSILLYAISGMKYKEVASLLEIKPREVRRYIERGIRRLNGIDVTASAWKLRKEAKKHEPAQE